MSILFYFWGEPRYTVLLLGSSVLNYLFALRIENYRHTAKAKRALITCIVLNLLLLGVFKYADFVIGILNGLFSLSISYPHLPLPVGISFFTFQTMSYTIDVYREEVHAEKNLLTLATYVSLFPQLIAGPIVRYVTVAEELKQREHSTDLFAKGVKRFIIGLAKKVLLANQLGVLVNTMNGAHEVSVLAYWLAALAYTLQIYFDFSGYSDMAIGLGSIFGFHFPENFNYPFISKSITEFWRRWHMTLGSWFRDYVYIPLGGNRCSLIRQIGNIAIVWALTGLWHGAEWNFVLWGLYFAVLLVVEKQFLRKWLDHLPAIVAHFYTMLIVIVSFVIFYHSKMSGIVAQLSGMFGLSGIPFKNAESLYYLKSYAVLLVLACFFSVPYLTQWYRKVTEKPHKLVAIAESIVLILLLVLATGCIVDGSFNPFLYFRF